MRPRDKCCACGAFTPLLMSAYDAMNEVMGALGRYPYNVRGIPRDEVLLSEVLSRRGYRTVLVGRWRLGGASAGGLDV
jgi:arylsulfatase A-like enzyme